MAIGEASIPDSLLSITVMSRVQEILQYLKKKKIIIRSVLLVFKKQTVKSSYGFTFNFCISEENILRALRNRFPHQRGSTRRVALTRRQITAWLHEKNVRHITTQTQTHTQTFAYTDINLNIPYRTIHVHIHRHEDAYRTLHVHTQTRRCIQSHTRTHTQTKRCIQIHTGTHTQTQRCIQNHTQTYTYTYEHEHEHNI